MTALGLSWFFARRIRDAFLNPGCPFLLSKVMKDWSDLEEKYQEMRERDPADAEEFKKQMTERFQVKQRVQITNVLLSC